MSTLGAQDRQFAHVGKRVDFVHSVQIVSHVGKNLSLNEGEVRAFQCSFKRLNGI
ncbi:hypothetical protein [Roseovarius indicus]|uniref:hypothetical protein n=1 Tax=Roseovarius indicus TaxID=540747 RepID=UPI001C2FA439|nr:hypothetical protein [Roseovarius indicus]